MYPMSNVWHVLYDHKTFCINSKVKRLFHCFGSIVIVAIIVVCIWVCLYRFRNIWCLVQYTAHVLAHWHVRHDCAMAYDRNHFRLSFVEVFLAFVIRSQKFSSILLFRSTILHHRHLHQCEKKWHKTHFWNLKMWICRCITLHCIFISDETNPTFIFSLSFFFSPIVDHSNTIKIIWVRLLISIDSEYCADASTLTNRWYWIWVALVLWFWLFVTDQ